MQVALQTGKRQIGEALRGQLQLPRDNPIRLPQTAPTKVAKERTDSVLRSILSSLSRGPTAQASTSIALAVPTSTRPPLWKTIVSPSSHPIPHTLLPYAPSRATINSMQVPIHPSATVASIMLIGYGHSHLFSSDGYVFSDQ